MVPHLYIETGKVLCIKKYASSPSGVQLEIRRVTQEKLQQEKLHSTGRKYKTELPNSSELFGIMTLLVWVKLHSEKNTTEQKARLCSIRCWVCVLQSWVCEQETVVRKPTNHTQAFAFTPYHLLASEAPNGNFRWFHTEHFSEQTKVHYSIHCLCLETELELHTMKHRCFLSG